MSLDVIAMHHRERCFAMEQRKRLDLALGSFLRLRLGWRKDLPEQERKAIATQASKLMDCPEGPLADLIEASKQAAEPFRIVEADAKKTMAKLAKQLPVWDAFGKDVRGFGEVSLAVIVSEAGDLSLYDDFCKLWKRMGIAAGQNKVPPNLSREERAEAWISRGKNPRRRSHMWNIGDALIKGNQDGKYRTIYLRRKEYEHARDPEMSKMHAHRRAQRYMEQRLLRDLWRAWRRAKMAMSEQISTGLPVAPISAKVSDVISEMNIRHVP